MSKQLDSMDHQNIKAETNTEKTGDDFQADSLCCNYTFYFWYQSAPKKYLDEGYSPLHARIKFLLD